MREEEKLYEPLELFLKGEISVDKFCKLFSDVYIRIDEDDLTETERLNYRKLWEFTLGFSPNEEDIRNGFYSEAQVREEAERAWKYLKKMNGKEILYYLIENFLNGNFSSKKFESLYYKTYNFDTDYNELTKIEREKFYELLKVVGRFSTYEESVKKYGYYSEADLRATAQKVWKTLKGSDNKGNK
ncbi:MAG: hypothetical protein ACM3SY_05235 [Candidatus Omnitrophota bacterium]